MCLGTFWADRALSPQTTVWAYRQLVRAVKAWARAKELRPTIELYDPDGSHRSELGTFLTACVFVATLTNETPDQLDRYYQTVDASGETIELMGIHPLDVVFCKKVAEEIILE